MPIIPKYRALLPFLEALCVLFLALSIFYTSRRSGLPDAFVSGSDKGAISAIDGTRLDGSEEIEFALVELSAGDSVAVTTTTPFGEHAERIQLVSLNRWPDVLFYASVSILFFLLGSVVYRKKRDDPAAAIFHLTAMCVSMATIASREISGMLPPLLGASAGIIFFLAYSFMPAFFLHFMMVFPQKRLQEHLTMLRVMYGFAILFSISQFAAYYPAVSAASIERFRAALPVFKMFNVYLLAGFLAGLVRLVYAYVSAKTFEERKKLRWIITGLIVGAGPYFFLWILPNALFSRHLVSEEFFQAFLLVVPVTFAIAIIKYRLMDIDVIIQRGTVYAIVFGLLIGCFLLVVWGLALVVPSPGGVASVIAAITTALIFDPVRRRVRDFVDRRFFHVRYDIRVTLPKFVDEIRDVLDIRELSRLIVRRTDELIAPERIGFFVLQDSTRRLNVLAHNNFDLLERHGVTFETMKLRTQLRQPVALDERIEPGSAFESADAETFRRWGIGIAFPMLSEKLEVLGFLVLGSKKSGEKFSIEDVNLLKVITTQAGLALERIVLLRKVFLEQETARHLAVLNQLKSFFVSSVSHDLKNPLSSIHMHAELLQSHRRMSEKSKRESLEIIVGESERLAHLIDNVLDSARIDDGRRHYDLAELELSAVVSKVLRLMSYELKIASCTVRTKLSRRPLPIVGDDIAIERAIMNLIANALKYSGDKKSIAVATRQTGGGVVVSVTDKGIGISPEDQQLIFDRYYRSGDETTRLKPGVGLGLSIVRHVMEGHGGSVEVASTPGKGSTFTLTFPRRKTS